MSQCLFVLAGLALQPPVFGQAPAPPTITSLSATSGSVGSAVTITGSNFSPNPSDNVVYFGAVRASVTTASTTSLTVTVPTGATYAPISVTAGGLTAYSAKRFTVTFPSSRMIDASSFAPSVDIVAAPYYTYGVAIADLDLDDKSDLAATIWINGTLTVHRNTATPGSITSSSFAPKVDFQAAGTPSMMESVDLDGDGMLDLVTVNFSGSVSAFRNISTRGSLTSSSFAPRADFPVASGPPVDIAVGDIDGDGRPDVLTANTRNDNFAVLRNISTPGNVALAAPVFFTSGSYAAGLAVGDLDGDGKPEVAVAHELSGAVAVFRNTSVHGVVSFAAPINLPTSGPAFQVAMGDVDGDGGLDLVSTMYNAGLLSVYRNSGGNLNFDQRVDFSAGSAPYGLALADLDGDGRVEVVVGNTAGGGTISVFRNTSLSGQITSGSFASRVTFAAGSPFTVVIGDLDGDGKPDLAANANTGIVSVFRNAVSPPPITISSVSATSGPIGSSVTITGSNFSANPTDNVVYFGAVRTTVTAATTTSLTVTVPVGATYAPISVTAGGLTAYSPMPFTVTFPSSRIIDANSFAAKVDFPTGVQPFAVAIADLDGDGKSEMVSPTPDFRVSVYRNVSVPGTLTASSFSPRVDFPGGGSPREVVAADLDGDGKLDIVYADGGYGQVSILRNTTTPGKIDNDSFAPKMNYATGSSAHDVAVHDLDGDGRLDIVVPDLRSDRVALLRNISAPSTIAFASPAYLNSTGSGAVGIAIADLNGDGKPDLIVCHDTSANVAVFQSTSALGVISFAPPVILPAAGQCYDIAVGDLDGDGKADLVTPLRFMDAVWVYRNQIGPPPNRAPLAQPDSYAVLEDGTLNVGAPGVMVNDTDADGDPLTAVLVSSPAHGNLVLNSDGSFTYTPNLHRNDDVTFTYKANDGNLDSDPVGVSISITPVNDQPGGAASPASLTMNEDALPTPVNLSGSDVETLTGNLVFTITQGPAKGTLRRGATVLSTGSTLTGSPQGLTYQPNLNANGPDEFKFKVRDTGDGTSPALDSVEVGVSITIDAVNDKPTISDIANQTINEDSATSAIALTIGDAETPADSLTLSAVSSNPALVSAANISFQGNGANRTLTATPRPNQSGTATIAITVTDGDNATASDDFVLTVNAVNDPPAGANTTVMTLEDTAYMFTAADFGFSDANDNPANSFQAVKITTLPSRAR